MPQVIAGALLYIGVSATVTALILTEILTLAISWGLQRLSQSLAGKPKSPSGGPQSRDVTIKGTVEPRQLIYGEVRTGGILVFYGCIESDHLQFVVP